LERSQLENALIVLGNIRMRPKLIDGDGVRREVRRYTSRILLVEAAVFS
jgi:hypothetical protein